MISDYEVVAMLNVSANKELTKQVEVLKKALVEKEEKISILVAQVEELKALKIEMYYCSHLQWCRNK